MSYYLPWLHPNSTEFPPIREALSEPNGLLAFGGDLRPARLISAYRQGIFPWFSENEPIMWWSPTPRTLLNPTEFHLSKSMAKFIRNHVYKVTLNQAFTKVISDCAHIPRDDSGTWITAEMVDAYCQLHELGNAHSIEVWENEHLVGGLYGVSVGHMFCGESMFHRRANASKLAMYHLCELLSPLPDSMIDCQMYTPHLASLGAKQVPRRGFQRSLRVASKHNLDKSFWQPRSLQ